jgi:type II secretory pathway pseudopilin PulG
MSPLIKYLLKTPNKQRLNSHQVNGFTMVELLVATIMSFLIITPILAFAVNILNDDVKEQAKASTELELQSALDYIQQDISQAFYIYDGNGIDKIKGQLYNIPNVNNEVPVLVFWKRELVKDAIDITENPNTVCSEEKDDSKKCDDTYVESLVVYYLVPETDKDSKWCQPGGTSTNCPSRIERWSIKDGARSANGDYLCGNTAGQEGQDTGTCPDGSYKANFRKDKGFNSFNYKSATSTSTDEPPLTWENSTYVTTGTYITPVPQVLVNYIDVGVIPRPNASPFFCANTLGIPSSPVPAEANYRIGTNDTNRTNFTGFSGCVDTSKNIAQITIKGDALRRNEARNADCDPAKKSPYCPSVSGQIGGMSGFGN